ncbi:MAG: MTH1187 family thiamine-binding protein [Bacillota bacterium]
MALLEISVVPVGTESPSFSSVVSQALKEAQRNGIKYDVSPTSTVMEGDLPALLDIAQKMHRAAFHGGTQRVVTNISIDERRDKDLRMEESVAAARNGL